MRSLPAALFSLSTLSSMFSWGCQAPDPTGEAEAELATQYLSRDSIASGVVQFAPIDDRNVYILDGRGVLSFGDGTQFTVVSAGISWFGVAGDPQLFLKDTGNSLWSYARGNASWTKSLIANAVADAKMAGSAVYYRRQGAGTTLDFAMWGGSLGAQTLIGNVVDFWPVDNSNYFIENTSNQLWWEGAQSGPVLQDGNAVGAQKAGTVVYVRGSDKKLWREAFGQGHGPNPVDANVADFRAIDSSMVFVEGNDGNLWREDGDYNHRDHVDGNVLAFQPTSLYTVWVLGTDRHLWREHLSTQLP